MSASAPEIDESWMPVARLLRPQGRRGELLADPLTDLDEIFRAGQSFRLTAAIAAPKGLPSTLTLEEAWRPQGRNAGRVVLKFQGIDSINDAEALQGSEILIANRDLPALDPDTFMVRDLIGCAVFDGETMLGTVVELQFPVGPDGRTRLQDAADLLVVERADAPEADPVLVPFVKAWLSSLDIAAKRIVMNLPPGLLDDEEDADEEDVPAAEA